MAEYERSRTMPAQPEQVFDQAADAARFDAWLPDALHVHVQDPPAVTVHEDRSGQDLPALLRAEPDQMRLEWGTREQGDYTGWLQVAGIGSGTSEVTVHLSFLEEGHDPGERAVNDALDGSLSRLEEQVRMRVDDTAG
ncbi:SRPBCC family protein [Streptomyces sp. NPDC048514]|uniref:SRPBCC family protein n=1 Tax=Streptomyces sp. NPDC048514 TaxID=3365564 RepID=UPI00371B2E4D